MLSIQGDRERIPLLNQEHFETEPCVSPDGRWMAYQSDESGRIEIYVRTFPDMNNGRWQVSTNGGNSPLWSPNGQELYYRSGDTTMAVAVETEPTFIPENPEVLFRGTYSSGVVNQNNTQWDISPDGKRFLIIKDTMNTGSEFKVEESEPTDPRKITIVLNWDKVLKEKVPAD